ncbi:hypothetical protein QBC47DRAFT_370671 [Echria macrotheca]|uniref:Uncharacterized protein n=1 Tax=Echria macrotheca TaxID=438768 RepID=A0AAJ0F9A1_9PEZI|nr:hypothetical protein QBC47DRAFT_370671 [Echria macrotheca]
MSMRPRRASTTSGVVAYALLRRLVALGQPSNKQKYLTTMEEAYSSKDGNLFITESREIPDTGITVALEIYRPTRRARTGLDADRDGAIRSGIGWTSGHRLKAMQQAARDRWPTKPASTPTSGADESHACGGNNMTTHTKNPLHLCQSGRQKSPTHLALGWLVRKRRRKKGSGGGYARHTHLVRAHWQRPDGFVTTDNHPHFCTQQALAKGTFAVAARFRPRHRSTVRSQGPERMELLRMQGGGAMISIFPRRVGDVRCPRTTDISP